LTAPCVASSEEGTNAFDVGTEPCADDDEVAVLDEADADLRDVDVVREVELAVKPVVREVELAMKPVVGADLAVELVDDCDWDVVAVEDPEPAV
jgi:hypothetical protein